jgi:hypothetical protein
LEIFTPIGFPAVFFKKNSKFGIELYSFILEKEFANGYSWKAHSQKINLTNQFLKLSKNPIAQFVLCTSIFVFIVMTRFYHSKLMN